MRASIKIWAWWWTRCKRYWKYRRPRLNPPTFGAKIRPDFIEGIAKVDGKFVILLNVNHVMSTEEISQMGQVAAVAEVPAS